MNIDTESTFPYVLFSECVILCVVLVCTLNVFIYIYKKMSFFVAYIMHILYYQALMIGGLQISQSYREWSLEPWKFSVKRNEASEMSGPFLVCHETHRIHGTNGICTYIYHTNQPFM